MSRKIIQVENRNMSTVSSKELPEPGQEVVLWRNPVTS